VFLDNLSAAQAVPLADGSHLGPRASREMAMPLAVTIGAKIVRVQAAGANEPDIHRLEEMTMTPGLDPASPSLFPALRPGGRVEEAKGLLRWLQSSMGVFQSAASSRDFFAKAAQAVVDIVGLDSGRVLLLQNDQWRTQAIQAAPAGDEAVTPPPSRRVLNMVRAERRTFWELSPELQGGSMVGVGAVVAAPILAPQGKVIGAVYGDRRLRGSADSPATITELEAMLVELLACAVAAGMARLDQEQAAMAARVQFEQFFTPELSRQLLAHPDLLDGRDCEVTLLFCDVRGFSAFSERLGPARTVQWIQNVMEALSGCVLRRSGVLVDYIGDQLVAMWGAPERQPDHAKLACQAALDMLATLPALNERWQPVLQSPMDFGIGINSGTARVGNVGSRYKFKYGPLGNTVNLASRVEGATKYLRARVLVTGATHALLDKSFAARRLCRVRVVNIAEPVDLYELVSTGDHRRPDQQERYDRALNAFERGDFGHAAEVLGELLREHPGDGPAAILLERINCALSDETATLDTVWELPGK
jgi:adenylate cyclase